MSDAHDRIYKDCAKETKQVDPNRVMAAAQVGLHDDDEYIEAVMEDGLGTLQKSHMFTFMDCLKDCQSAMMDCARDRNVVRVRRSLRAH